MDGVKCRSTGNPITLNNLKKCAVKKISLITGLLFCAFFSFSQNDLNVELNAIKTAVKNNAVGFAINYLKPYNNIETQLNGKSGFLNITPEILTQAGTNDAFSNLVVKLSGFYLKAKTIDIAGLKTLDSKRMMHIFPISVGLESNTDFSFLNSLVEFGYIPYYQSQGNQQVSDFLKLTKLGIFIQTGYKSKLDSINSMKILGGKLDESAERPNRFLCRSKIDFSIDTKNFFKTSEVGLGLVGKFNYWIDFVNGQTYYKIDGRVRLYLSKNKFFDLMYQKGSGAPNFNTGEQFGTALSMNF